MFSGSKIQLLTAMGAAILTTVISCVSLQGGVLIAGQTPENTILLDFHGSSCPPCQAMRPIIAQLKESGYPVRSINVDQEPLMADRFGVQRIPCFIMISAGKIVARTEGLTSLDRLARMCQDGINDALRTRRVAEADYRINNGERISSPATPQAALAAYSGTTRSANQVATRTEAIRNQFSRDSVARLNPNASVSPIYIPPVAEEVLVRNPAGASANQATNSANNLAALAGTTAGVFRTYSRSDSDDDEQRFWNADRLPSESGVDFNLRSFISRLSERKRRRN